MIIDHIEQIDVPVQVFPNALGSLETLRFGLHALYKSVRNDELRYLYQGDRGQLVTFNDPSIPAERHMFLNCCFHWYSVSLCNYAWLVGHIINKSNSAAPTADKYRADTIPQ